MSSRICMRVFTVILIITMSAAVLEDTNEDVFGACQPGKESCRDCYITLVKSLLGNDGNMFNLSHVFTTGDHNEPSFVRINYWFQFDDEPSKNQTWFWAKSLTYLFLPLDVFQFISIFFGNPSELYETTINLMLNGTECYGASTNYMGLLTQRLKIYVRQQSIFPAIPIDYKMPTAAKNVSALFDDIAGNVLVVCPIITLFATVVTIIILMILFAREDWERTQGRIGISDRTKAIIVSVSFISFSKILLFVGLDVGALLFQMNYLDNSIKDILYSNQTASNILYNIPIILLVFDAIALFLGIVILICPCIHYNRSKSKHYIIKDFEYYCFALTVIPLVISCLNHAPYIIMAYISDSDYASSIFVYYMVTLFLEFGIIQYAFRAYFLKQARHMIKNCLYCTFCRNSNKIRALIFTVIGIILTTAVNGTMISVFIFFYYIPISYVLSSAPSQAILIYQSAIVLIGGYIAYKTTFEKGNHTNQQGKYDYTIIRQTKGDEIAYLEQRIVVCKDKGKKKFFEEKIAHRRTEIFLASLHERIISVLDDSTNPADTSDLHLQQNEAIEYLLTEIKAHSNYSDNSETPGHEQQEIEHLKNEIFCHLQNKMDQIWKEPSKLDKIPNLTGQINELPDGNNKCKLNKMRQHLEDSFNI